MNSGSPPFECPTSQLFKTVHSEIFELEQQDLTACSSVCISDCLSGRQEPTFLLAFKRERLCLNKSKHHELSNVMIILTHLRRYLRWLECLAVVPRVVSSSSFCLPAWIWLVYKIIVLSADHFLRKIMLAYLYTFLGWVITLLLLCIILNYLEADFLNKINYPTAGKKICVYTLPNLIFKKWIQFLECSWNHEYFGSVAKI